MSRGNNATPKRWVSWAAVSSAPQAEKISLDDQRQKCAERVAQLGGTLIEELIVPGESRSIMWFEDAFKRIPAYARLKELVEARAFDVLIFYELSRLGRDELLILAIIRLCQENGIAIYNYKSPPPSLEPADSGDYSAMLLNAIMAVGPRHEVELLKDRHRKGMAGRVKGGEFPGAVPWGWQLRYEIDGDSKPRRVVEEDPIAANTIRQIVYLYLEHGLGTYGIATQLNALGRTAPRGGQWGDYSVLAIINRIWRYAGWQELNKTSRANRQYIRQRSRWPAIITDEQAAAVAAEQQRRRNARRSIGKKHRFSQVVYCQLCNQRMSAEHTYSRNKRDPSIHYPRVIFRCYQRKRRSDGSCIVLPNHPRAIVRAALVEQAVEAVIRYYMIPENRVAALEEVADESPQIEAEIEQLQGRYDQLRRALYKIDDQYVAGIMDDERYRRQVERINAQLTELEVQLAHQRTRLVAQQHMHKRGDRLAELAEYGLAMLTEPNIGKANAWFRKHIRVWARDLQVVAVECI